MPQPKVKVTRTEREFFVGQSPPQPPSFFERLRFFPAVILSLDSTLAWLSEGCGRVFTALFPPNVGMLRAFVRSLVFVLLLAVGPSVLVRLLTWMF